MNVAMTIDGAADLAGAAGILGRKAVQAVTKSFAEDSVGAAEKTFNVLGKESIAEDIANKSGGRLALPEPKKMLALPAPEERLALPTSEERLALPEPEGIGNAKELLPGEGNIGTYDELIKAGKKGDNITPHHAPSSEYMKQYDVNKGESLSINMEQPKVGGRHRMTDTYGHSMTDAEKEFYYSLSPRDALAYDIKNLRNIYKNDGLYKEILPKLRQYVQQYQEYMPDLFKRGAK